MQATAVRDASGRVIVALMAAGRSMATIERHEVELGAFAGFLEARGRVVPTEVDCLDFIPERSGVRLAGLREPTIWWPWSLVRLWVIIISRHSVRTALRPLRRNRVTPRLWREWPNTGPTICLRFRYSLLLTSPLSM